MTDAETIRELLDLARRPVRGWQCEWRHLYRRDVAALLRLVDALGEKLYATSTQLGVLSERKERRGV